MKEKADKYDYTTRMQGISKNEILVNEDSSIKESGYKVLKQKQKDGLLTENEIYILDKYFMDILKWFKDKDGNRVEYLQNETLRKNFAEYFEDPSVKQLFNTYPKRGGDKKIFENVNNHILSELGFEFISKRKQYRDKTTCKMKETKIYTVGYCKILKDYLERKEKKEEEE